MVEGAAGAARQTPTLEQGLERVAQLRAEGLSLKDAARQAAKETGLPKNELYGAAAGAGRGQ